ncbi:MAG: toll/interleukin-1 receptor domain-containing protein [Bacteroidales bacterium]|nr:toll/interleukin-1 receptor domain-containing protein [Bacteroidales bacterium]
MGYILSKEQLNSVRNEKRFFSILNESMNAHKRSAYSYEVSVFLSHKHSDRPILENVITMLNGLGVYVYVDWIDDGMPSSTSGYTASRIKQKIRECKKFILLATEDAIASKWCNWELGYGDAQKYPTNIAVMPITEKRGDIFSGNEYLQIYPIIKSDYEYILSGCYVDYGGNRISLVEWLKK